MRTRAASPADYDRIVGVLDDWWGRPVASALPRLFLDHFAVSSRVAEDEDGLAGFLVGFRSPTRPDVGYVHFVGVRPDQRRLGLARRLYAEFADQARAWGCRELWAITSPANTGSVHFHERMGFTASTADDYNGRDRPMVVLRHRLSG